MPTLDEIAEKENFTPDIAPEVETELVVQHESRMGEVLKGFITAPTGEGSIEDYLQHPLNFKESRGMAQILRGLSGIVGDLKLAVIDIVLGALSLSKEKTREAVYMNYDNLPNGGNFPS